MDDADGSTIYPVSRQVVHGHAVDLQAASASQVGQFETQTLVLPENRDALADVNGR